MTMQEGVLIEAAKPGDIESWARTARRGARTVYAARDYRVRGTSDATAAAIAASVSRRAA